MRNRQGIILTALAAGALGLATSGRTAPESPSPSTHHVQVKIEWVATPAAPAKSLTITTAPDQLATGSVEASASTEETQRATVRSHINDDRTFSIGLILTHIRGGKSQRLQMVSLFKPGERTKFGAPAGAGKEDIYVTATAVEADTDPFQSRTME